LTERSSTVRGRGRSTTLNPADRRRPRQTLSLSCHDSTRQKDHIWTRFLGVRLIREGDLYASIYGTWSPCSMQALPQVWQN